jgi:pilus assembly protein CpaF
LHANGVSEIPARVEALAMLNGVPRAAAHSLLAAALRVAVHLQRTRDGVRRVAQIAVLERDGEWVRALTALSWDGGAADVQVGPGAGLLRELLLGREGALPAVLEQSRRRA